ncbi:hypothetical protein P2318_14165 [Myxococcaceae bacterium GXIMD 01537]
MSRCRAIAAALVDEALPRPGDFEEHLAGCADCRAVATLHAEASTLRLPGPPPLAPVPRPAILGEVRRREHRRRLAAGALASVSVAALAWLMIARPVRPSPAPAVTAGVETASLGLLLEEVDGYTRREPAVRDESYSAFGALATWVRPPDSARADTSALRVALTPSERTTPQQEEPR